MRNPNFKREEIGERALWIFTIAAALICSIGFIAEVVRLSTITNKEKASSMREIKFRAWSKEWNKYSKPFTLHCDVINFTNPNGLGIIKGLGNEIIEQFTGLLDKNGKEIYEGDVLEFINESMVNGQMVGANRISAAVEYVPATFSCGKINVLRQFQVEKWGIEIIGNIHQDKHLLEQRKGE